MGKEMANNECIIDVYNRFKKQGFPYYSTDKKWRDEKFNVLMNTKLETIIDRRQKIIQQNPNGLSLAWSYMRHAWGIKCGKMRTPMEIWEDEEHLKKGINKILSGTFFQQKQHYEVNESDMRSMLRRYSGTQMVSNFRPTAAAAMYSVFCEMSSPLFPGETSTVWDPSMGYGGRLLGAILAGVNYIGTDPCIPTYEGLEKIRDEYGHSDKKYELLRQGSETYIPEDESLDFVFTSPPYFGWEAYGDEPEQSSIAYDKSDMLKEKFLRQTIKNAYKGLKKGKFLALNVANTKQYKTFEEDTVTLAKESGFEHTDTWWLSLSTQQGKVEQGSLEGTTEVKQKQQYMGEFIRPDVPGRKFEPTFIFQK